MKCSYHPDRDAVNTCSRCGQPVCSECNYVTGTQPICRNCWQKLALANVVRAERKKPRVKSGLVPAKTYLKEKEAPSENITPPADSQLSIDKAADLIELGLNGIGNGIIWLGERMANVFSALFKIVTPKQ
jgi:hypothetical protein